MGTLLISKVKKNIQIELWKHSQINLSNLCIPSTKVSDTVIESNNAILSINQLIENVNECMIIDNEGLHDISLAAMSGVTCSLRFSKIGTQFDSIPRLHFLMIGIAPLTSRDSKQYKGLTVSELLQQMFISKNMMCAVDPKHGKYLTASAIFRGRGLFNNEIECMMLDFINKSSSNFVEWISNNIKYMICEIPPKGLKSEPTFCGNSTSIQYLRESLINSLLCIEERYFQIGTLMKDWIKWNLLKLNLT